MQFYKQINLPYEEVSPQTHDLKLCYVLFKYAYREAPKSALLLTFQISLISRCHLPVANQCILQPECLLLSD